MSIRSTAKTLTRRPNPTGVALAVLFWWFSLVPSLMPRSWPVQAAISAVCAGIGYSLGTLVLWLYRYVSGYFDRNVIGSIRDRLPAGVSERVTVPVLLLVLLLVLLGVGGYFWVRWQNQQRDLLAMEHLSFPQVIPMFIATAAIAVVLGLLGRLLGGAVRRLDRWNRRHLRGLLAVPTTIVLVIVIGGFLLRNVAFRQFVSWADASFSVVDQGTADRVYKPGSSMVSGGPSSLVSWDDLGLQGRSFVAGVTDETELVEFADRAGRPVGTVEEPVRVYSGLRSADTAQERAELAVRDLERAGGFERRVLVVATSTGTGWIDPDASHAIELMYGGDTAIVSMQYSFLPSWISFITDLDRATEAGAVLYQQVYERWSEMPADDRPKLIAFGLSLGSYGATGAFTGAEADTSISNIQARSDGALFVGTPYSTTVLRQLVSARDAGSVSWAPIVDAGRAVRFDTRDPDQERPTGPWKAPRVLFVQHPSDPVTHWYFSWLYSKPGWMDDPRGFDVPVKAGWFPIVTGVQGVFDLMAGFSAPPGHGHDYRLDYPSAWAEVVPPQGWTRELTKELEEYTVELRAKSRSGG